MPFLPKKSKKSQTPAGKLEADQRRANQLSDQRAREMATRSTLSRLRNRKSDLK